MELRENSVSQEPKLLSHQRFEVDPIDHVTDSPQLLPIKPETKQFQEVRC